MAAPFRTASLIVLTALAASPAAAQWGTIFGGDNPPRPPATVGPGGPDQRYGPPPPYQPEPPPTYQQRPQPPIPPRGPIQSEPLPPPPGARSAPAASRPPSPQAPPSREAAGAPPAAPSAGQPPAATPASLPPPEEVIEPPAQKIANPYAVFSGLDKITGRIISFQVAINETVRFGALEVTPRACYTRPPTETSNTDGFVEVDELTLQGELRRIFTGWMFASSPGLNAVEHPIYDVWLTDCKGGSPPVAEAQPAPPPKPPARQQPPQQRRSPPAAQRLPPPPPPFR